MIMATWSLCSVGGTYFYHPWSPEPWPWMLVSSVRSCTLPAASSKKQRFSVASSCLPWTTTFLSPKSFSLLVWGANRHTSFYHFTTNVRTACHLLWLGFCRRRPDIRIWVQKLYVRSELRKHWKIREKIRQKQEGTQWGACSYAGYG